jgi:hypothetical protein
MSMRLLAHSRTSAPMTGVTCAAVWILFVIYLITGLVKIILPIRLIPKRLQWVHETRPRNVRVMGVVNLLGAFGVLLPLLTGILPWLAGVAAIGLVVVQCGAIRIHIGFRDFSTLPVNIALLLIAAYLSVTILLP